MGGGVAVQGDHPRCPMLPDSSGKEPLGCGDVPALAQEKVDRSTSFIHCAIEVHPLTYIKIKGQWMYLYRAVDKAGRTVDFLLSKRRDVAAAQGFFSRAIRQHGAPRVITLDSYAASHRAVAKLKAAGTLSHRVRIRSSKYLNNVVEQDHRRIKQRLRPMLGLKRFETAAVTIQGIELAEKIKKQQFNLKPLTGKAATARELWAAVLAA